MGPKLGGSKNKNLESLNQTQPNFVYIISGLPED